MALQSGTVLGGYEVLEPIGAGGMGEVYRARDSKLGRDVAIKLLPEAFSQDEARRQRFEREARVLASLNHDKIGAIYGLEQNDDVHFLVLELIPGETLADRLRSGPLPASEAIAMARQIVEALEAAHEKGIVHRDLKPANIKITPDGKIKVLDFGLAKAFGADESSPELSNSPTLSMAATREGLILGTAAYMSPEQAKGMAVDKRTDIFSFGCVLFEMLTGRRPFHGDMASEILASVIKSDPDYTGLPANVHPRVGELLRRSLEKDRQKRWRDIGDVGVELDRLMTAPEGVIVEPGTMRAKSGPPLYLLVAAVLLAFVVGAASWNLVAPAPKVSSPVARFSFRLSEGQTLPGSGSLAVSPDGTMLGYTARSAGSNSSALYLRPLDQLEPRLVPDTEGARAPFFSPDGEWVAFFSEGALRKVSIAGGAPIKICDVPGAVGGKGGAWGPGDTIVFHPTLASGLWRVSGSGGTAEELTSLSADDGETGHLLPEWLPNGEGVLFGVNKADGHSVDVLLMETGERRTVVREGNQGHYVRTGHVLYGHAGGLMAVPFDADTVEVVGAPIPIQENVRRNPTATFFSLSESGTLVYAPAPDVAGSSTLVWVDREGQSSGITADSANYGYPRVSPDGRRVAVSIENDGDNVDIWVYDVERGSRLRLTSADARSAFPSWSPDGSRVAFTSNRSGDYDLYWIASDGSGQAEGLLTREQMQLPGTFSADGKVLSIIDFSPESIDIMALSLSGDPSPVLSSSFAEFNHDLSPDGRFIAYESNESGRYEVYVQSFPEPGAKWAVSKEGGRSPVWSADGSEIFFQNDTQMLAVAVDTRGELRVGEPRILFDKAFRPGTGGGRNYDAAPDGSRFVMIEGSEQGGGFELHVVVNWADELEARVASK